MQVYLVGGAVRDALLGLPVVERDWVVVGATPAELEALGYRAVGREFPVFLHPETHEEYALARLERKSSPGYRGFVTDFSPDVTLEEDLKRRDLTVNAIARGDDGVLVDPYGGRRDLDARVLRHVSEAFSEDPVRILRVARFLARFAPQCFTIAPETMALMRSMVASGEVAALVPERVWRELARALAEPRPDLFFTTLADCGALQPLLPELAKHFGSTKLTDHSSVRALQIASTAGAAPTTRFAILLAGLPLADIDSLCTRLRVPTEYRDLAEVAARLGEYLHAGNEAPPLQDLNAERVLKLLELADAWRRPERFAAWLEVLSARAQAAGVPLADAQTRSVRLQAARDATAAIKPGAEELKRLKGAQVAEHVRQLRLAALRSLPSAGS